MSTGSFNCIFCTESFESREVLQVHFRKHGDPNLHASLKTGKKRTTTGAGVPSAATPTGAGAVGAEEVSCDVCAERFPSVARAITHKHKFHRDHRVKHFCPWCGKLFPIKHLFNKHMVAHEGACKPAEQFRCDQCSFEFYSSAAVTYHNRSFHRADAPAPAVPLLVGSRKYRLVNKELVQLFFCHLCGHEYINSLNLQKHVSEQHSSEEWSEPGAEVLRCPRCDAAFHSRAAYAAHLAYHSPHDIYVHTQDSFPELTEFTLETVPPIIEKMEPAEHIDIDQMLAGDLELSSSHGSQDASSPAPASGSAPDKKNKPPRKAITLNQFLSMNKDVFGDVLNFQGVEEIPSQVVANQLRPKRPRPHPVVRPGTKVMSVDNLQKLKQQGVVVQVKTPNRKPSPPAQRLTVANGLPIGKPIKIATGALHQQQQPRFTQPRPVLQKIAKPAGVRQPAPPRQVGVRSPAPPRQVGVRSPAPPRQVGVRSPAPPRQVIGKPLKILPNATRPAPRLAPPLKKPIEAELSTPGPFSCFKKPKESLIPISDVPGIAELLRPELSAPPTAKPSLTSTLASVKTSATTALPAAKTSVTTALSAVKSSITPDDAADSDSNKSKNKTVPLEALEKLRKQGLLVKKPKLVSEGSRESPAASDAPCLTVQSGG